MPAVEEIFLSSFLHFFKHILKFLKFFDLLAPPALFQGLVHLCQGRFDGIPVLPLSGSSQGNGSVPPVAEPKNKGRMGPKAGWLLGGKQGCFCLLLKKARYRASKRFLKLGMERYLLAGGKALVGILEALERLLSNDAVRGGKEGAILIPFSGKILPPFATESQHFSRFSGLVLKRKKKHTH